MRNRTRPNKSAFNSHTYSCEKFFRSVSKKPLIFLGWLDDLTRFQHLVSLNLADNDLKTFPFIICQLPRLIELNLASNNIDSIPSDIAKLQW